MTPRTFNKTKLQQTLLEGDRNFYAKSCNNAWQALKAGQDTVSVFVEYFDTGWCLIFLKINDETLQLTKRKVRQSDLIYIVGA